MTTEEIAKDYYRLARENRWEEIIDTYYDDDVECIEPPNSRSQTYTKGLKAVKDKAMHFQDVIKEFHSGYVTPPIVAGNLFAVGMGMDITFKDGQRSRFDEIGIFTIRDGKVVKEEFVMQWIGGGHLYGK